MLTTICTRMLSSVKQIFHSDQNSFFNRDAFCDVIRRIVIFLDKIHVN